MFNSILVDINTLLMHVKNINTKSKKMMIEDFPVSIFLYYGFNLI